jgi:hypothetical protein
MKKLFLSALCALALGLTASADEGMWLLPYLQKTNYADMKAAGLKLKATDIYNPDGQSLKDAIIIFGSGCTGEIVSPDGLIFTNHHCGYGSIQQLSTTEHDYLADGFWAMNRAEEIPVPGLSVHFIRKIEEVTDRMTEGLEGLPFEEYTEKVNKRREELSEAFAAEYPGKKIRVESFFGGNQYFLFVMDEYTDIRFVGAPPSSIGKFGGDTDNWMWPRHTGDFSVFRVYAAPDGTTPADYSPENVPYKAPVHLTVSAKGYKDGDFTMVMGFPGSTTRYMTTYEIDEMLDVANPNRILIRGERQEILRKDMEASDRVRIQYSDKYANSSNYWKNSIGMSKAVRKLGIRDRRREQEAAFTRWAQADPARSEYLRALPLIAASKEVSVPLASDRQVLNEAIVGSVEVATIAAVLNKALPELLASQPQAAAETVAAVYKDYNEPTDRKVAVRMIELTREMVSPENMPEFITTEVEGRFGGDVQAYVDWLYDNSVYANREKLENWLAAGNGLPAQDPALAVFDTTVAKYVDLVAQLREPALQFAEGHKLYIKGLLEMDADGKHYPDANFTIRLTYGNVKSYDPADAVHYDYFTTLEGVMEKEDELNPTEFTVPARLKELYAEQDYGRYADLSGLSRREIRRGAKEDLRTCFVSTNDITGGNSGSPVLNDRGQLIGLAFDGNWDAMSGDVLFETELQRCINVDVRYVLFVIDKFAGAGHLLDEMTIVW